MAFEPKLADDEELMQDLHLVISSKLSLQLVLTSKAAYWPGSKFAISDGVTTEVLKIEEIEGFDIGTRNALGGLVVGILMILGGLGMTFAGAIGYPQAWILGGVIVVLVGHKRRVISIVGAKRKFRWKEPISFGGGIKRNVSHVIEAVEEWAKEVDIRRAVKHGESTYGRRD